MCSVTGEGGASQLKGRRSCCFQEVQLGDVRSRSPPSGDEGVEWKEGVSFLLDTGRRRGISSRDEVGTPERDNMVLFSDLVSQAGLSQKEAGPSPAPSRGVALRGERKVQGREH